MINRNHSVSPLLPFFERCLIVCSLLLILGCSTNTNKACNLLIANAHLTQELAWGEGSYYKMAESERLLLETYKMCRRARSLKGQERLSTRPQPETPQTKRIE